MARHAAPCWFSIQFLLPLGGITGLNTDILITWQLTEWVHWHLFHDTFHSFWHEENLSFYLKRKKISHRNDFQYSFSFSEITTYTWHSKIDLHRYLHFKLKLKCVLEEIRIGVRVQVCSSDLGLFHFIISVTFWPHVNLFYVCAKIWQHCYQQNAIRLYRQDYLGYSSRCSSDSISPVDKTSLLLRVLTCYLYGMIRNEFVWTWRTRSLLALQSCRIQFPQCIHTLSEFRDTLDEMYVSRLPTFKILQYSIEVKINILHTVHKYILTYFSKTQVTTWQIFTFVYYFPVSLMLVLYSFLTFQEMLITDSYFCLPANVIWKVI